MGSNDGDFYQNVVVMRHGDRLDYLEPLWEATAPRPWDPPLHEDGKVRAFHTGEKLRKQLCFPIHRVLVSPFLRCLETAAGVVSALCAVESNSDDPNHLSSNNAQIKVSVEYGLSEMMNSLAIRDAVAPKDGKFNFDILQCEAVLPTGTVDKTVELLYKEPPKWQETLKGARDRYIEVIKALADRHPKENLLLVTHGEGVGSAVSGCMAQDVTVSEVEYCAYMIAHRSITFGDNQSVTSGDFILKGLTGITVLKESNDPSKKSN